VISGFRGEVDEKCVLLGYCTTNNGKSLLTFRDNLPVPSSRVKNPKRKPGILVRGLYKEECGRWYVLSSVVPANRVDAGGRRKWAAIINATMKTDVLVGKIYNWCRRGRQRKLSI
jgi:hypothetical protein